MTRVLSVVLLLISLTPNLYAANLKALLIGISQYHEIDNLAFADRDVLEFGDFISYFSNYFHADIDIVTNQNATKSIIYEKIDELIRQSQANEVDETILMFCGHGRPDMGTYNTNIFFAPADASMVSSHFVMKNGIMTNDTFITKEWVAEKAASINSNSSVHSLAVSCSQR